MKLISRRSFLKHTVLSGAAVTASLTFLPGWSASAAQKKGVYTMKYATHIGPSGEAIKVDTWFLDEIVKRSDGRIKVQKFFSSSLVKAPELLSAVRGGQTEMSILAYGYYPSDVPLSRGLEWYYRGCDHADGLLKVCRDVFNNTPELKKEWEQRNNSHVLYFSNWGYCPFMMKTPMPDVASLKNRKVRGYGIGADTINRLGGRGMPIVAGEVYTSLERGILEGVFSFAFITAEKMKLHEQAPNIVEGGAGAHAPSTMVMNRTLWRSLPDDLKEIINKTADEVYEKKFGEIYERLIAESVDAMVKKGAKFSTWSPAEIAKAKAIVQPAQTEVWIEKIAKPMNFDGAAFQAKIDALIKKYPGKLKNPWEVYREKYGN